MVKCPLLPFLAKGVYVYVLDESHLLPMFYVDDNDLGPCMVIKLYVSASLFARARSSLRLREPALSRAPDLMGVKSWSGSASDDSLPETDFTEALLALDVSTALSRFGGGSAGPRSSGHNPARFNEASTTALERFVSQLCA